MSTSDKTELEKWEKHASKWVGGKCSEPPPELETYQILELLRTARTEQAERDAVIAEKFADSQSLYSGKRGAAREIAAAIRAAIQTDDDKCPRCGGSFAATGGKPVSGPYQCQACAESDYLKRAVDSMKRDTL